MRTVVCSALALLLFSSCVAVRFPEEIKIKIEVPENASPEQISAVMSSFKLELPRTRGERVRVVVDSIPGSR